jgi:hypothetical protein
MFMYHPMFWAMVFAFFFFASRRRRRIRRWEMAGPMGYAQYRQWGWSSHGDAEWTRQPPPAPAPQPLAQPDRTLVESLESRIAELETRLEFAERLMAKKAE